MKDLPPMEDFERGLDRPKDDIKTVVELQE